MEIGSKGIDVIGADSRAVRLEEAEHGVARIHAGVATTVLVLEILSRPAANLAFEIIAGVAKVPRPNGDMIDAVKRRDSGVHRVELRSALARRNLAECRVPENPSLDQAHDRAEIRRIDLDECFRWGVIERRSGP